MVLRRRAKNHVVKLRDSDHSRDCSDRGDDDPNYSNDIRTWPPKRGHSNLRHKSASGTLKRSHRSSKSYWPTGVPPGGGAHAKLKIFYLHRPNRPSAKNGLNLSQNSLVISASQKARVRLSCERVHDDQTEKDGADDRTGEAATSAVRAEGRASAVVRCRRDHFETDADRLCPRVDRRPEPSLAARRPDRSRVRKDFHRADVGRGDRPPGFA